ncbi:type I-E CRISPR-associated protein Cas5/CasD [Streptantibioticus silvisoli]|uniref:Type I-E CRISPR-associated protein Cas5/CasD n=1 Tax=Streptantibioticus silvisoli TaxID=2705255 RepID=A0ABT6W2E9_9ACTN|nr:type I-E CRISPR-associated protein Cas5/CasD [Streptantibioticus silvisoli]MDI5964920.1 type I-E CRISPR-associated protein Cas5/CasD [Streptantibioticus silvisoli]
MTGTTPTDEAVLVLRFAAPLQSWGGRSAFNRRDTRAEPTKSGVLGLLAAAAGRTREQPIEDLLPLRLGVRVDQPGTLLRDYHTVSDYRERPLLQSAVNAKGVQKLTSPAKNTHLTTRYYLQDAVFVAAIAGPRDLMATLETAVRRPAFPIALGRRSCAPTQPVGLGLYGGGLDDVLTALPWQAAEHVRHSWARRRTDPTTTDLAATVEDPAGDDVLDDVPTSFDPLRRGFTTRNVRHTWLTVPTGLPRTARDDDGPAHDPFALLG